MEALNNISIELWFMLAFIVTYASTAVNTSKNKLLVYINSIIYSFSGLLFMYYIFDLKVLVEYKDYFWVVAFLAAITFQQLLPVIMDTVVVFVESKLGRYKNKYTKGDGGSTSY